MGKEVMRAFAGEGDWDGINELLARCQAVDRLESPPSPAELREELLDPPSEWSREVAVWEAEGALSALAIVQVSPPEEGTEPGRKAFSWWMVDPAARDSRVIDEVIEWADARAEAIGGPETPLTIGASDDDGWRMETCQRFGFATIRFFLRMVRRLDEPLPDVAVPDGYTIRPLAGEHEVEAWVELSNAAFADHWEHHATTADERRQEMSRSSYLPELDLVAAGPGGDLVAFVSGAKLLKPEARDEFWIGWVGTHPDHRRRGLARVLLAEALRQAKAIGAPEIMLSVDAESPTGATRLYEALGFTVARRISVFRRVVGAG